MSGFEFKLLPAEIEFMNLLDVSVEHLTLIWMICVRMLPKFVGIFEGYNPPKIPTKDDWHFKGNNLEWTLDEVVPKTFLGFPRINQWRDLRFIAGIVTSLGAVFGNIAGIGRQEADVSSKESRHECHECCIPRKTLPFWKLFNRSFTFYQVSQKLHKGV